MNSIQEETINKYCSILKTEKKLIIRFNDWRNALFAILGIILCLNPLWTFFLILIYLENGIAMFYGIGSFITYLLISMILLLPIVLSLGTFKRKHELILDKSSKTVRFNETSPRFKQLEVIKFQEIEEVSYQEFLCMIYSH